MMDIQRDPENAKDYVQYFSMLDEIFNPAQEQPKPLTGESLKRATTAQSGIDSINELEQTLATDPGAFKRQALPNPFGITAGLTGTSNVRAATDNVIDVIARLRSGAAITDEEAARFGRQLPQPGDTAETAAWKLAKVRRDLQAFASDPGGSSLEDAMMQAQQGGFYQ
jgi:hypothetical protein